MSAPGPGRTGAPDAGQSGKALTGTIRPFRHEDSTAVADLSRRVFEGSREPAPPALASYFAEVFLEHPWADPELPSRVYVAADGAIRGFAGLMPLRMSHRGRPIRAAIASSIMVEGAKGDPLAGARLLRAFLQGPQDLSIGENATDVSRRMWLPLGARSLSARALKWVRILRPAGLAAHLAARRIPPVWLLRLPGAALDPALTRLLRIPMPAAQGMNGVDVAPEELADIILQTAEAFALRPDFDAPVLRWMLSHAARKEQYGAPLARIVSGRGGRTIGGYLGHVQPHGMLRVMQVFAAPAHAEAVIDDLFAHAWRLGAVAVSGGNQPELTDHLQLRQCVFRHGGFTLAHSRSPELLEAMSGPGAFLNGLVGETWARLSGGRFD